MSYVPPVGDNINFIFADNYTSPAADDVDIYFSELPIVTIVEVSTDNIFDNQLYSDFNTSIVKWTSSMDGIYRIEVGGTGVNTGYLIKSGRVITDIVMRVAITDVDIEASTTFSGTGNYRFNIYVKGTTNLWNPYED